LRPPRISGKLSGAAFQRRQRKGLLARTGRATAAIGLRLPLAVLARLDQLHNALRYMRERVGPERRHEIGRAGDGAVAAAVRKHGIGRDDVTTAAAHVDSGRQLAAGVA
jgi:hypothetical protein